MWWNRGTPVPVINCSSVLIAQFHVSLLGLLEDGKSAQTGVTTASATAGTLTAEKRNNGGPQCANPMVPGTGAPTQRQNGCRTAEVRVSLGSLTLRTSFNQVELILVTIFRTAVKPYLMPGDKRKWLHRSHGMIEPSTSDNASCLNSHKIDVLFGDQSNIRTCYSNPSPPPLAFFQLSPAVACIVQTV